MTDQSGQSFGVWLRETRKARGLTLKEVSEVIRIDEPYLRALESGNIAVLPEPYIRAFLKTYAEHLGLDRDEAVRRLESFLAEQAERLESVRSAAREKEGRWSPDGTRVEPPPPVEKPVRVTDGPDRQVRRNQMLTAVVVVAAIAAVTYVAIRFTGGLGPETPPPSPQLSEEAEEMTAGEDAPAQAPTEARRDSTAILAQTAIDPGERIVPPPVQAPFGQEERRLHLFVAEALEQTWMQAVADGDTVVSRIVYPGDSVRIPYTDTLSVRAGKTHGLFLTLDGREITGLGPPGNVLSRLLLVGSEIVERRYSLPPEPIPNPSRSADRAR